MIAYCKLGDHYYKTDVIGEEMCQYHQDQETMAGDSDCKLSPDSGCNCPNHKEGD